MSATLRIEPEMFFNWEISSFPFSLQLFGLIRQFCHCLAVLLDLIFQYIQVFGIAALIPRSKSVNPACRMCSKNSVCSRL